MSYSPRLRLQKGENSVLFLSSKPADLGIVFIHGFGGNATSTWRGFEDLSSTLKGWDVFFYGYSSWAGQANSHAEEFRRFISGLFRQPQATHSELRRRYRHILIVAHSLGAVVTRRALLNAGLLEESYLDKVSFVLFAPAHRGGTEIVQTYPKALDALSRFLDFSPGDVVAGTVGSLGEVSVAKCLRDMVTNSLTLGQLESDTLEQYRAVKQDDPRAIPRHLVARKVVFGHGEDIVDANRFCFDPVAEFYPTPVKDGFFNGLKARYVPGYDHLAVCKPVDSYMLPLSIVLGEVQNIETELGSLPKTEGAGSGKSLKLPQSSSGSKKTIAPVESDASSDDIHLEFVPDPQAKAVSAERWLKKHLGDHRALAQVLRDHRLDEEGITLSTELELRDGLDIILDRVSILELAYLSGYHTKPRPLGELQEVLSDPAVRHYYEDIYPSPLVVSFMRRLPSNSEVNATGKEGRIAFLRFAAIHSTFNETAVVEFRRLLDDYYILDPSLQNPRFFWVDLLPVLKDPEATQNLLMSRTDSAAALGVQGYRDFMDFTLDLQAFCLKFQAQAEFIHGVKLFYDYWFDLFRAKFGSQITGELDRAAFFKIMETVSV